MKRGRRKAFYRRETDFLESPHEEAEILCKALRRVKNLGLQGRYVFGNRKNAVEGDPQKSWSGIEAELNKTRWG